MEPIYCEDTIPTLLSNYGKAWKIDLELARKSVDFPMDATVGAWIVEAAWAHPIWHSYIVAVVHLRPMPGGKTPKINMVGATHEIFVVALDPEKKRPLNKPVSMLTPINFAGQWIAASDEEASRKLDVTVHEIMEGVLNPDTDAMSQWIKRFSASNVRKGWYI